MEEGRTTMSVTRVFFLGLAVVVVGVVLMAGKNLLENVNADEIMVIQSPISGEMSWYTTPGIKWQGLGKVTKYTRRSIYEFQNQVRFNDGGHATMHGSIQYEMPLDVENLTSIHVRFGSPEAVQRQLVETVVNKSVYLTGPLMSSKESFAEKRNSLIHYVEDQVENGVYQTTQRDARIKDPITGAEKTATVVEIVGGKDGLPMRQEEAVLTSFGIKPFNFSITQLSYDDAVDQQIQQQQQLAMDVQTAIAESKKAEQRAITVAEQGKADAAKAKWEQEVEKAKAVTLAQQEKEVAELEAQKRLAVATLDAQAAGQYKSERLLRADADAEYKRRVMEADGALTQKLEAMVKVNELYADAIKNHPGPWVPSIVMGGGDAKSGGQQGAMPLIDLLTARTAQQLAVDLKVPERGAR